MNMESHHPDGSIMYGTDPIQRKFISEQFVERRKEYEAEKQ